MARYILRMDNGLIGKGERCRDEPRFTYLKALGNSVDITTSDRKLAKVFEEVEIPENGIRVHSKGWKFIEIK
ncbi:MAG: hypothetical protein AAFY00_08140 [Bacteroidota bacterium]